MILHAVYNHSGWHQAQTEKVVRPDSLVQHGHNSSSIEPLPQDHHWHKQQKWELLALLKVELGKSQRGHQMTEQDEPCQDKYTPPDPAMPVVVLDEYIL